MICAQVPPRSLSQPARASESSELLVVLAEKGKQAQEADLDPWGGHAVVVEVAVEAVFGDLLQDRDEARYEVFVRMRILLWRRVRG